MKIEVTDPTEIHLLLLEKYQKSSANIVIRAVIDQCFDAHIYAQALNALITSHPYLCARYTSEINSGEHRYYYEEVCTDDAIVNIVQLDNKQINSHMNTLSSQRNFLFKHDAGVLYHLNVFTGDTNSMLELTCPHIIGEIPSILILMGELLANIDQIVCTGTSNSPVHKKYNFNENDFAWDKFVYENLDFESCDLNTINTDPWVLPDATLERHKLDALYFKKIKNWLSINNINATTSDLFYNIAHHVLTDMLGGCPDMWLILSYRSKAVEEKTKSSIYNFAFFAPVNTSIFNDESQQQWLESICTYRQNLITQEGVYASRNFFYSLNKAMEGKDLSDGKNIMNSLVKFPDFAFNNFGQIDPYVGKHKRFNIIDFDVQDGTPAQEIRYFSLGDTLYINPTFFNASKLDITTFWAMFEKKLMELINV